MSYLDKYQILDKLAENQKEGMGVVLEGKNGQVKFVEGVLGELRGCGAFVEDERKEPYQVTKFYGIDFWFNEIIDKEAIDCVTLTKKAFKEIIRLWPIRINKITNSFLQIYRCENGLKSRELKAEEFCPFCQELIRAGLKITKEEWRDLIFCFAMFLQYAPSFKWRLQDILPFLNKYNFQRHPLTEIVRLKRIFMARSIAERKKMKFLIWIIIIAVLIQGKTTKKFVAELDLNKAKMDEADSYFCLRRETYNFGGLSLKDRIKKAEQIDKAHDHLIIGL